MYVRSSLLGTGVAQDDVVHDPGRSAYAVQQGVGHRAPDVVDVHVVGQHRVALLGSLVRGRRPAVRPAAAEPVQDRLEGIRMRALAGARGEHVFGPDALHELSRTLLRQ
jgi:hypothetical protein